MKVTVFVPGDHETPEVDIHGSPEEEDNDGQVEVGGEEDRGPHKDQSVRAPHKVITSFGEVSVYG